MSSKGISTMEEKNRLENSEIQKGCTTCKQFFPMKYFINKQNGRETLTCLKCRNSHNKSENKENTKRQVMHTYYAQVKAIGNCELCGDNDPTHLEFDHNDPTTKIDAVSNMKTLMAMKKEIDKCRLLCKKCHRKISAEQYKKLKKKENINREYINSIKIKIGKCENNDCKDIFDIDNLPFYEFDHKIQEEKEYCISQMASDYFSFKMIDAEISKCRLLCSYCHYKICRQQTKNNYDKFNVEEDLKNKIERHEDEIILAVRIFYLTGYFNHPDLSNIFGLARTYITKIINNTKKKGLILSRSNLKSQIIKYISQVFLQYHNLKEKYTPPKIKYSDEKMTSLQILFMTGEYDKKYLSEKLNIPHDLVKKYTNEKRKDYPKKKFKLNLNGFKIELVKCIRLVYLSNSKYINTKIINTDLWNLFSKNPITKKQLLLKYD